MDCLSIPSKQCRDFNNADLATSRICQTPVVPNQCIDPATNYCLDLPAGECYDNSSFYCVAPPINICINNADSKCLNLDQNNCRDPNDFSCYTRTINECKNPLDNSCQSPAANQCINTANANACLTMDGTVCIVPSAVPKNCIARPAN